MVVTAVTSEPDNFGYAVEYLPEVVGSRARFDRMMVENGLNVKKTLVSYSTAGAVTYTPADIFAGLIQRDPAGAARTDVLPTAAVFFAALDGWVEVDTAFPFTVYNTSNATDSSEIITVSCGTNGVFAPTGTRTIAPGAKMDFELIILTCTLTAGVWSGTYEVRTTAGTHPLLGSVVTYDSLTTVPKIILGATTTAVSTAGIPTRYTLPTAYTSATQLLTFADLRGGIISNSDGINTMTFPTTALIAAGLGNVVAGDTLYFSIIANSADIITLTLGDSMTGVGAVASIPISTSASFALRMTSASASVLYRVA